MRPVRERKALAPRAAALSSADTEERLSVEQRGTRSKAPERPRPANGGRTHRDDVVTPPETGRPETAQEFSKRIKRLVLHGPRAEREEGDRTAPHDPHMSQSLDGEGASDVHTSSENKLARTVGEPTTTASPAVRVTEEPLLDYITSSSEGVHLQEEIRGRYGEDPFFGNILTNPKQFKNFDVEDGLILLRDRGRALLCIPNIIVNARSVREIVISHAHSLLAHLGPQKTASLLRDHVWWKT
ncbi:hypothetical protein PYCCODRAFT_1377995, partial [Trametes coccinea BRFM310]